MNKQEILKKLHNGEMKIYQIEDNVDATKAINIRREYISQQVDVDLKSLNSFSFDPDRVYGSNCENVIGGISLPLGIAGPVNVNGKYANGDYLVPLSTTEGALVASINRGCKIINESGGVDVIVNYHGMTRAPLFRTKDLNHSALFREFLVKNESKIKEIAESTSNHLTYLKHKTFINGRSVWPRFHFDTDQAMGMNMVVKALDEVVKFILTEFQDVELLALSGNLCIDKKPSMINTISGRGREVDVELKIPSDVVNKRVKSSVDQIVDVNYRKNWQGSALAGSLGYNAHIANMVTALFIALGQDPAHVVDASTGMTSMEEKDGNLYVSVKIPSLNIATVGGGTSLLPQKDLLDLILTDVNTKKKIKQNRVNALAEIIGTVIIAGEISLIASFAGNNFSSAHESLGRSKS
jgi:hydroxymethylglutaryl-CoA reductase (NADPH)